MMTDRRCKICDRLIPVKRRRRHPGAVLCGSDSCDVVNQRRRHNRKQATWRLARGERDPEWRAHQSYLAGLRYQKRRARAAAKKELVERAHQTNERAAVDTSVPITWADKVAALCGPVTSSEGVGGRE